MSEYKDKVEAILFTTGDFMTLEELGRLLNLGSMGIVKEALEELKTDYLQRGSSLELINEGDKWKLNVKSQYGYLTNKLMGDTEFDRPTTKTLAVIAFKNPALQSEVIKTRGNKAYDHIKALIENELVTSEKKGRTRLLKLTPKFYNYFNVNKQDVEGKLNELKELENKLMIEEKELEEKINFSKQLNKESSETKQ